MKHAKASTWVHALVADLFLLLSGCIAAIVTGVTGWVPTEFYLYSMDVLTIIELCFFVLFILIETISAVKISDSTWHTVFLAVSILLYHVTTEDFLHVLGDTVNALPPLVKSVNFFAFELTAFAILLFWNYTYGLGLRPKDLLPFALWTGVCLAAYVPLTLVQLHAIAFAMFALVFGAAAVLICIRLFHTGEDDLAFHITLALVAVLTGSALTSDVCEAFSFYSNGFPAFHALPMVIAFLLIYVAFAMRTDRAALRASEYKLQYERIKARALREQIKPHFVFNTLAAIQSLYRTSLDEGDRATTLLSQHLRTNIEASDIDLIPFEKELDNIEVYIDLENMRLSKKINVIFDIDCSDFEVPVLSLQPYIENAIKYSRVNEKEDGYIRITSRRTKEGVLVEVADNGVGFDTRSIPASSCGIRNSSERLSMLVHTTPEIVSEKGVGTTVRIFLKEKEGNV